MPSEIKGLNTKMSLRGLDESLERIAQLGRDIDEAGAEALFTGAELMQESMQELAPVDTGNLRDHIRIKGPEQDGNRISVSVGVIHDRAFTDAETARYAVAQEYGWISTTGAHSGRAYIRGGRDRSRRPALQAMKKTLARCLT